MPASEKFLPEAEIRLAVFDVRDATHSLMVGSADVVLDLVSGNEELDEWFEVKQDILDKHGELAGTLTLNLKYSPLRAARGQPQNFVEELVSADYEQDKTRLADLLLQVHDRLENVENVASKRSAHTLLEVKTVCASVLTHRKQLRRPCVTMAKKILRCSLRLVSWLPAATAVLLPMPPNASMSFRVPVLPVASPFSAHGFACLQGDAGRGARQ
jgi:hypothetical protein